MKSWGKLELNNESYVLVRHEDYLKWLEDQEDIQSIQEARISNEPSISLAELLASGGNRIAEFRKNAKLKQSELAKKVGATQSQVSQWESGSVYPRQENIFALAEALKCEVLDLFPNFGANL